MEILHGGYGLVQWTPASKYIDYIGTLNDPSTMDNNLKRIVYEVENNIQWIATSTYNYTFEEFTKSTDSAYTLAMAFLANYERPADPSQPSRGTQAEYWYSYLGDLEPNKPTTLIVAPFIQVTFYVTGEYGTERETHTHVGIDLATTNAENLYSIFDGIVIDKGYSDARGYYIVIKSSSTNYAFLYQHMASESSLNIGDTVYNGQLVGVEGTSGDVTGLHLHMEMQLLDGRDWYYGNDISYYINPAEYMGFDNITGTECYYNGVPYTPPTPEKSSNTKKWLFSRAMKVNIHI